jgi:hypothetical protein
MTVGCLTYSGRGGKEARRPLRFDPLVAVDFRVTEDAAQEIDADVATVRVRNGDGPQTCFRHVLVTTSLIGAVIPKRPQLADKLLTRARGQSGHPG